MPQEATHELVRSHWALCQLTGDTRRIWRQIDAPSALLNCSTRRAEASLVAKPIAGHATQVLCCLMRSSSSNDTKPIHAGLLAGAEFLRSLTIPDLALPAFLLDSNRAGEPTGSALNNDVYFDNRSLSFPTDFPSGVFLKAHGIERVLLVQLSGTKPQRDINYTLGRWQNEGLRISSMSLENQNDIQDIRVQKPSWLSSIFYRATALLSLSRNSLAGFGATIDHQAGG